MTHQTVSGFTATGSSGGSLQFTSNRNLWGFRLIDGRGDIHEFTRDDADPDALLLDVAQRRAARRRVDDHVRVHGPVRDRGPGGGDLARRLPRRPVRAGQRTGGRRCEQFLRDTEFARLEWWPQRGSERVLTWQASRIDAPPDFRPTPYKRFEGGPEASEQLISILFTILGNLDDLSKAKPKLEDNFDAARARPRGAAARHAVWASRAV